MDNSPEFIAAAMARWAEKRGVEIKFIEKGKPYQNGYMERFNRSFREEVLDAYVFTRLKEAQVMAHAWMWTYYNQRPHKSLNYQPAVSFLKRHQGREDFPTFQKDDWIEWKAIVLSP